MSARYVMPGTPGFCLTCNARERRIVDGRCIVCGCDPHAVTLAVLARREPQQSAGSLSTN